MMFVKQTMIERKKNVSTFVDDKVDPAESDEALSVLFCFVANDRLRVIERFETVEAV